MDLAVSGSGENGPRCLREWGLNAGMDFIILNGGEGGGGESRPQASPPLFAFSATRSSKLRRFLYPPADPPKLNSFLPGPVSHLVVHMSLSLHLPSLNGGQRPQLGEREARTGPVGRGVPEVGMKGGRTSPLEALLTRAGDEPGFGEGVPLGISAQHPPTPICPAPHPPHPPAPYPPPIPHPSSNLTRLPGSKQHL